MDNEKNYLEEMGRILGLDSLKDADSTLLSDDIIRIYFDECVHQNLIDEFKEKLSHCCDIRLYNCHVVDIVKKEPFIRL